MTTRTLHVANGGCTTSIIQAAGIPGFVSIWADPLYEGPVPGGLSDDDLLDVRARHHDPDNRHGGVNDMRLWRQTIEAAGAYDELVLWFEHDLFDQLALVQLLPLIRQRVPAGKTVSLVCIGSFPGHPRFKGLGELAPDDLASLVDRRERVTDAQHALAGAAWDAFRSDTPEALDRLRSTDTSALPYLSAALTRFLEEYPSTADGLSRSERRLLHLAEHGPIDLMAAFPRMHDGERAYYITDSSLGDLATTLAETSPPLLTVSRDGGADRDALRATVALTDAGRDVLAGRRDRVACGIDRWLGGVHLEPGSIGWRWDDGAQRIVCI